MSTTPPVQRHQYNAISATESRLHFARDRIRQRGGKRKMERERKIKGESQKERGRKKGKKRKGRAKGREQE